MTLFVARAGADSASNGSAVKTNKRTEADDQAWRDHRDGTAGKYAMWERGEKFLAAAR